MSEDKLIEGHEYDGIKELDNPLPKWWLYLFYATIVFSVGYYFYYEMMGGPSHHEQLETSLANYQKAKALKPAQPLEVGNVDVKALMADSKVMQKGKEVYIQTCASCHGQAGEGVIGPNFGG